jgi:hypothetical protein
MAVAWPQTRDYLVGREGQPEIALPDIIDHYPTGGPPGSHVYVRFARPISHLADDLQFFYNGRPLTLLGIAEDLVEIIIPLDERGGSDGLLEARAGGATSNGAPFNLIDTVITPLTREIVQPSSELQTVSYGDEIAVTLPPGMLDSPSALSIARVAHPPPHSLNPSGEMIVFDVTLEGFIQLEDYIKISLKYDPDLLSPAADAPAQLLAVRWDEATGLWHSLPYHVDSEANIVYIYTDHLSLIGIATSMISLELASRFGEYLFNHVYVTPQGSFRIWYNRRTMDADQVLSQWEQQGSNITAIWRSTDHPRYIQDIGELFEIALENYLTAGFKNPVKRIEIPTHFRQPNDPTHLVSGPIEVKIDSLLVRAGGPKYEKLYERIHLPLDELQSWDRNHTETPLVHANSYTVIGHELFHRLQHEYYTTAQMSPVIYPDNYWWLEASAEYAGNRVAWTPKAGRQWNYLRQPTVGAGHLTNPLNRTGQMVQDVNTGQTLTDKRYEYAAALFVQFLVEVKGLNFASMAAYVAGGEPFPRLNEFIAARDDYYLRDYYAEYAAWAIFAENGFLSSHKIADFSYPERTSDEIADQKDKMQLLEDGRLTIEVSGGNLVRIDLLKLSEGERLPGDAIPRPLAAGLRHGSALTLDGNKVERDDVLYFLIVNSGAQDDAVTITTKIINQDGDEVDQKTRVFNLKGSYSVRLWAIKMADDIVLRITPEEIRDGRADQEYTFQLQASYIPEEIRRVYFAWDFGDLQSHSQGRSDGVWVEDGQAAQAIAHRFASGRHEAVVTVHMKDSATDETLATATATVFFYTVSIEGSQHVIHELTGGVTQVEHEFKVTFSPPGLYSFYWQFGDGQTVGFSNLDPGDRVVISHLYQGLRDGDIFYPSVELQSQAGQPLAQDAISIYIEGPPVAGEEPPAAGTGGYWRLVETIEEPGDGAFESYWHGVLCSSQTASWSNGQVAHTVDWPATPRDVFYNCENNRDMTFSGVVTWTPPPPLIYPDTEIPHNGRVTVIARDTIWPGSIYWTIWRNTARICGINAPAEGSGSCEESYFTVSAGNPQAGERGTRLEISVQVSITGGVSTPSGERMNSSGRYVYIYEWTPSP